MTAGECVGCHALPDIVIADDGEYRPGIYVRPDDVMASVHAGFACTECHSSLKATMHDRRDAARESCAACHEQQDREYEAGYHATSSEGPRPTCITCHGSHRIQDANTREFVHRASEQCARCHEQMNERFMGGNAFGMETHLAGEDVATCADCHGYHTVLPTEDARSPVNEANILTTCRQCHLNAPANFVDVQMHLAEGPIPEDPRLRVVTIYMLTLLIATFGFFGYLTVLGIRHEWRRQAERARSNPGAGGVL
jgi:nitrate/TMAO reductase-like tetraheme cytochrome c subunit